MKVFIPNFVPPSWIEIPLTLYERKYIGRASLVEFVSRAFEVGTTSIVKSNNDVFEYRKDAYGYIVTIQGYLRGEAIHSRYEYSYIEGFQKFLMRHHSENELRRIYKVIQLRKMNLRSQQGNR